MSLADRNPSRSRPFSDRVHAIRRTGLAGLTFIFNTVAVFGACAGGAGALAEAQPSGVAADPAAGPSSHPSADRSAAPAPQPTLTPQESGTTALLQAVSVVNDSVVWVSGHRGTVLRTTDGGRSWHAVAVPGADSLEFRDVDAVDERTAYVLSAGPGDLSRIYKTTDAGRTWTLQFRNTEPEAFFDCMAFWDARRGLAFSDAVAGEVILLVTEDGGEHWTRVPPERVPDAQPGGEGAFAASGTCVVTGPGGRAWIGTGAGTEARVFRTEDYGRTWSVATTPVVGGAAAGIFSLAFRDAAHGVALGGDLNQADAYTQNVAVTADGGRTWSPGGRPRMRGAVFGGAYVPGAATPMLVAVGPAGMDYSTDEARTWMPLDTAAYWSVGFAPAVAGRAGVESDVARAAAGAGGTRAAGAAPAPGWAVGPRGRVVKIEWR